MAHRHLQFEVSLLHIEPRIWRRFLLAEDASFEDLHKAIQDSGGWEDYHLYEFAADMKLRQTIAGKEAGETFDGDACPPAAEMRLSDHFQRKGKCCWYRYDFGDDWEVEVKYLGPIELEESVARRLLDGARAFPLEDSGGPSAYPRQQAAAGEIAPAEAGVSEEDLRETREWMGDWQPDEFDLEQAKQQFDLSRDESPVRRRGRVTEVKRSDVLEHMDAPSDTMQAYVDRSTGKAVLFSEEEVAAAEDGEDIDGRPQWEQENIRLAGELLADASGRFVALPGEFDFNEWDMMRNFALSVEDKDLSDSLMNAIHGRGAFRYFKDVVHRRGVADQWYASRNDCYREIAQDWAEANHLKLIE